jgi:hypothetical protein
MVQLEHPHCRESVRKPVRTAVETGAENHRLLDPQLELCIERLIDVLDPGEFVVVRARANALSRTSRQWAQRRNLD